ncbi:MAG: hypothetical protein ACRDKZ_08330 [Actinomycetota bacterium]
MKNVLHAEVKKLSGSPMAYWLAGAGVLLPAAIAAIVILTRPESALTGAGDQESILDIARLSTLFAFVLGAVAVAGEFRHGTIAQSFLGVPRRMRLVVGKAVVHGALGLGLGLAATALITGLGWVNLDLAGVDFVPTGSDLLQLFGGLALGGLLWGLLGVGLGALATNQVAVIAGGLVWIGLVEGLAVALLPEAGKFLPGRAATALIGVSGELMLSPAVGGAVLAGWATAFLVAGLRALRLRDIA